MIYFCSQKNRRTLVLQTAGLNGIDYLEVAGDSPCGKQLAITFLKDARSVTLTPDNFSVTGGAPVEVVSLAPVTMTLHSCSSSRSIRPATSRATRFPSLPVQALRTHPTVSIRNSRPWIFRSKPDAPRRPIACPIRAAPRRQARRRISTTSPKITTLSVR